MTFGAGITISGMNLLPSKPAKPLIGDCYIDNATYEGYMFDGTNWIQYAGAGPSFPSTSYVPTEEPLKKHPALKQAWDEYLVIWKLLGL